MKPKKIELAKASVLVVGDAMLDRYWFGDVDRISPEAPVPIVRVTGEEFRLGGAANVALNIASLGARAALLSVVGSDDASVKLQDMLRTSAIETFLKEDIELRTTVKLRVSGRSQQLLRVDFENRPNAEALAGMITEFQAAADKFGAVLFSDYGKGGLTHISRMIKHACEIGKPVLIDPKGSDYSSYKGATVLTPNRSELAQVIGPWENESKLEERAQMLREKLELGALLVTRSEEGMSLFDADGHMHVAAQAREVFDVTGAGDTVIATLGALLAHGMPLREAVPFANRAGGLVVGKFGTATATFEELFG